MQIVITRYDGGLQINPAPPYITDYLKYSRRSFGRVMYRTVAQYEVIQLHHIAPNGGVLTFPGFFEKIVKLIKKNTDTFEIQDRRTPLPEVDWNAIKNINWAGNNYEGLRDYQIDLVIEFLAKTKVNPGIVCGVGGIGKTVLSAVTYAAYNQLNTILAIPLKLVFNQTYEVFSKLFPFKHIGRCGDGHTNLSKEITISTFKSLPKCDLAKCQLLLVDEIQSTTGDSICKTLMGTKAIRNIGFTATDKGTFSQADKIIKGLFGERLVYFPYEEAEAAGAVVPGIVYFVKMPSDVMVTASTIEGKISQGIKNCKERNKLIGDICKSIPKGMQTLIFVDHIQDHLVKLYKELPVGTKFLHRCSSKAEVGAFALTPKQQDEVVEDFKQNKIQYLMATDCARSGFDTQNCRVVVQASGGSSKIEVLQEAYRGSRTLSEHTRQELGVEPKTKFYLVDIQDNHDETLANMALKRLEFYRREGWEIREIDQIDKIDWVYSPVSQVDV